MDEKTGWRKVEKIDESMVGWEVKAESPYSIVEIIVNVEGNDFWVRNKDGDHRTLQMSLYDWLSSRTTKEKTEREIGRNLQHDAWLYG